MYGTAPGTNDRLRRCTNPIPSRAHGILVPGTPLPSPHALQVHTIGEDNVAIGWERPSWAHDSICLMESLDVTGGEALNAKHLYEISVREVCRGELLREFTNMGPHRVVPRGGGGGNGVCCNSCIFFCGKCL